jgi:hypothetical protein
MNFHTRTQFSLPCRVSDCSFVPPRVLSVPPITQYLLRISSLFHFVLLLRSTHWPVSSVSLMFVFSCEGPSFIPMQNCGQNYNFIYFILLEDDKTKDSELNASRQYPNLICTLFICDCSQWRSEAFLRRGADKSLVFPICSTAKRISLGWVKEVRTTKS